MSLKAGQRSTPLGQQASFPNLGSLPPRPPSFDVNASDRRGSQNVQPPDGARGDGDASSTSGSSAVKVAMAPAQGILKNPVVDLKARLYDRPENCQALITVQRQQQQNSNKGSVSAVMPRPPSGKAQTPGAAFRTTMFKRDYARRQMMRKGKQEPDTEPALTLNMLHRRPSRENLAQQSSPAENLITANEIEDIPMTPVSLDDTNSVVSEPVAQPVKPERKTVTFVDNISDTSSVSGGQSPDELPSESIPGSSKPGSGSKRPSTGSADPSLVLGYLKKNIYDDTEPENDNFVDTVVEMRKQLNWVYEIPRHGPGCKKKMEALKDIPDKDKNVKSAVMLKEDDGKFVYALPRNRKDPRARYHPYDLQVVSPNLARSAPIYWTASATNISIVDEEGDSEDMIRTPVLQWLWERRLFNMINDLPVFVKYRIWKAFNVWRINVRHQKNSGSSMVLYKTLFSANEILQGCMLHIRSLCEVASGSLTGLGEGDAAISLVHLDKSKVSTLPEFMEIQQLQCETALTQLNALRDKVVDMVWQACSTVAEKEGITHGIHPEKEGEEEEFEEEKQEIILSEKEAHHINKYKNKFNRIRTKYGSLPISEPKPVQQQKPKKKKVPTATLR